MHYGLGLVHIYTGAGKGKTSASIGLGMRALGHNLHVLFCQFFKFETGEKRVLEGLANLEYRQFRVPSDFFKAYDEQEKEKAKTRFIAFWQDLLDTIRSEKYEVVILDEVIYAIHMGLGPASIITELIKNKPAEVELILTGRDFPDEILALADYVSEIVAHKHPFTDKQIEARKGIEY